MNPSRPFILRPVATILFMVAILLSGLVAWRMLPVAALPEVDYPTIQVVTYYPGRESGSRHFDDYRPAGTAVRPDAGAGTDVVFQFQRRFRRHAAIFPFPDARRGGTGSAGSHQRSNEPASVRFAEPADL